SVAPDDGALRPGTGVNGESGAVVEVTVLDDDVVRNPPDDAVTVEIAHRHLTHRNAIRAVQANAAIIERTAVEHFVVVLVAVNREVLNHNVSNVGALEKREIGGDLRLPGEVETLLQAAIESEAIARRGD